MQKESKTILDLVPVLRQLADTLESLSETLTEQEVQTFEPVYPPEEPTPVPPAKEPPAVSMDAVAGQCWRRSPARALRMRYGRCYSGTEQQNSPPSLPASTLPCWRKQTKLANHTNRSHAVLSASSSSRWLACPPSAQLCAALPDTVTDYALEGTCAHELAEYKGAKTARKSGSQPSGELRLLRHRNGRLHGQLRPVHR